MKGDLTIRLDQDGASMACFYNHLRPRWQVEQDENDASMMSAAAAHLMSMHRVPSKSMHTNYPPAYNSNKVNYQCHHAYWEWYTMKC